MYFAVLDSIEDKSVIKDSVCKEGAGRDPNKPPCKKAKLMRLERKKEKLLSKGITDIKTESPSKQKSLEDFMNEISVDSKKKLKVCYFF